MIYLASHFWAWGLAALAIGLFTAVCVRRRPERGGVARWLVWFGLAVLVGLPVAFLQLLAGRSGLWLETGLGLLATFIVGAALGSLLVHRGLRKHESWAIGLLPLAALWWAVGMWPGRWLEQDLKREAASAAERVGGDPLYLDVSGRDVLLPRDASSRDAAAIEIARISGVRRVAEVDALAGAARTHTGAPPAEPASPKVERPATIENAPAGKSASTAPPPDVPPPESGSSRPAPAAPPATGQLDAAECQAALSATLVGEPIQFRRGSASIRRVSTGVLDRVIRDLRRCPRAKVEVRGFRDPGERHDLARERAERVVDYLARMGVEKDRLEAVGQAGSNEADETRLVDFLVDGRG